MTQHQEDNPIKKLAKILNRHFSKAGIQVVHRHMKRCSTSLAIREMQIKTTVRFHLTPLRLAFINKSTNSKCCQDVEKRDPSALLAGMQTGAATVENSIECPQKTKHGIAF